MRFLGIDGDGWFAIVVVVVFLIFLAIVSWLTSGVNLWDEWLVSVWD